MSEADRDIVQVNDLAWLRVCVGVGVTPLEPVGDAVRVWRRDRDAETEGEGLRLLTDGLSLRL